MHLKINFYLSRLAMTGPPSRLKLKRVAQLPETLAGVGAGTAGKRKWPGASHVLQDWTT